ncbi:hypothetical protein [Catellatospora citrea]|uniref:Dynamin family protein n=1 Tax=Catellatospora citrea TaxID=53366 RepID=A0A8J3KGU0_9ACTN|nr:hypothetical protein [Catellatospora citrea]RKE05537.1 hypothetical protein C8E86_0339 [Catellatospora citrea]GIF96885.1 hypothetical protein Cci01nite_19790 [Catellatospora citrea]
MIAWPLLYADRWAWAARGLDEAFRLLYDVEAVTMQARFVNVMLVGDSQVGKTSLLIRLLGVHDPADADRIAQVLRAGRPLGQSSTSMPIRYSWSTLPDRWQLNLHHAEPRWLDDEQLTEWLAAYRTQTGGVRWEPETPPIEIGLPLSLGGDAVRSDVRVLDLPGVFAKDADERRLGRRLLARFAPVMNLVIFVQSVNRIADTFNDEAITSNLHLADWATGIDRFRFVLTHSFSDHSVQDVLTDCQGQATPAVLETVRAYLRTEFATAHDLADPSRFAGHIFPVELGESWAKFRAAGSDLVPVATAANERALQELRETIRVAADDDTYYTSALDIGRRIIEQSAAVARRRDGELVAMEDAAVAAANELAQADARLEHHRVDVDSAKKAVELWEQQIARLRASGLTISVRAAPNVNVISEVRARQGDDCRDRIEAARTLWYAWQRSATAAAGPAVGPIFPLKDSEASQHYHHLLACCGECKFWSFTKPHPEECWKKMTAARVVFEKWLVAELARHGARGRGTFEKRLAESENLLRSASLSKKHKIAVSEKAEEDLDLARRVHQERSERAERDKAVADSLAAMMRRHNAAYVQELLARMPGASPAERPWLAAAILRSLKDLERMTEDA